MSRVPSRSRHGLSQGALQHTYRRRLADQGLMGRWWAVVMSSIKQGSHPGFKSAPIAVRVIYLANQDSLQNLELYSVEITGGSRVKLNGPLCERW